MTLDYTTLEILRNNHPGWRLLSATHAPLVASFLNRVFIVPNVRIMAQSELLSELEDYLYALNDQPIPKFPKLALEYLNDWAANDKGWLRKFYRQGSDEPHFDIMPSTEKAIAWLSSLSERSFVGTESRLLTLFELLKQMADGSENDPAVRIKELEKKRTEIDRQIEQIRSGQDLSLLNDTALKDRFQQFVALARELLSDFREVEHNFRGLDRRVRERIALREGAKGQLLELIMGERDDIAHSDQGRSFKAFWDFLMSSQRQEEFTDLLEKVLALPAVAELTPDSRLRRVHYDWLEAGDHTQRTVAQLSQQLRRFLDDAAAMENRRIMEILRNIEARAVAMRDQQPSGELMSIASPVVEIELPMERPLYAPTSKVQLTKVTIEAGDNDTDDSALFSKQVVDVEAIARYIRQTLQKKTQVTLAELVKERALTYGLSELIAYVQLATSSFEAVIDETTIDIIRLNLQDGGERQARVPRIIFVR